MKKLTRTLATSALLVLPVIAVAQLTLTSHALPVPGGEVTITTSNGTSVIIEDEEKKETPAENAPTVTVAGERKEVTTNESNDNETKKNEEKVVPASENASDTAKEATADLTAASTKTTTDTTSNAPLPTTGPGETVAGIVGLGLMTYLAVRLVMQRRELRLLGA